MPNPVTLTGLEEESFYTNISHELAIQAFTRRFQSQPRFVFLLDLLKFVLTNNAFTFDGQFFQQTCDITMGTSLALATIALAY